MTFHRPTTGRFLAYDDGEAFHLVELPEGTSLLGRSPRSVLPLDGAGIAQHHAAITVDHGAAYLVDDGSPTGTWVDGERVWHRPLRSGDTIQLGNATLGFVAA